MLAESVSRIEKEKFLDSLDEDTFRDRVVRRLFYRLGLKDGRDLCGPEEHGRDALFLERDAFGNDQVVYVQTKTGNLNLSSNATTNIITAITQLQTAVSTPYPCVKTKKPLYADKVFLCASGRINDAARKHIVAETKNDQRIKFLDRDELITLIDERIPELWLDIASEVTPYLSALANQVDDQSIIAADSSILSSFPGLISSVSDSRFIDVKLVSSVKSVKSRSGRKIEDFELEEVTVGELSNKLPSRLLIVGDAGTGKSTLLLRLAYLLAKKGVVSVKSYNVPIVIRALSFSSSPKASVLELAVDVVSRILGKTQNVFTEEDLVDGRVSVFVDGLDEIGDQDGRQDVLNRLAEFADKFPRCAIAISARPYESIERLKGIAEFERMRLSAISVVQAEQLFKKIKKINGNDELSKEIVRRLFSIHGIELNPLLITVFALSTDIQKRDIPANIAELFSKFTELMLGRWDEKKGIDQQFHAPLKNHILAKFAFNLHRTKATTFSKEQFRQFVEKELAAMGHVGIAHRIFDEVVERSGLFRLSGDIIEFRHHLIQEFFAGKGIPDDRFVIGVINDDWWRNGIVFFYGNKPDDVSSIYDVATSDVPDALVGAATIGLAIQTCYLSKMDDKIAIWKWVAEKLSIGLKEYGSELFRGRMDSALRVLSYYLSVRDAVALSGLAGC